MRLARRVAAQTRDKGEIAMPGLTSSTGANEANVVAPAVDSGNATNATVTKTITPSSGKAVYLTGVSGSYSAAAIGLLTIAGPAPTVPTATAELTATTVASVTVGAGGSGYTTPPTVAFTGGGGTGAAGTAVLTADAVTSVTITNAGSGYTARPPLGSAVVGARGPQERLY